MKDAPAYSTIPELLLALGKAGAELATHPGNPSLLRYRPDPLPNNLEPQVRACKPYLLAILQDAGQLTHDAVSEEVVYVMLERLGVADDLQLPTHVGSASWLVAVGEGMNMGCAYTSTLVG